MSFTRDWTQDTSDSSEVGALEDAAFPKFLPLLRNPKEAEFLSLVSSSPYIPQSNLPSGEPQSKRLEGIAFAEEAGEESPE